MGRAAPQTAEAEAPRPIIIRKVKKGGHGHHGGSCWRSDRANAARRALVAGGLAAGKIGRVVGLASSVLLDPSAPGGDPVAAK